MMMMENGVVKVMVFSMMVLVDVFEVEWLCVCAGWSDRSRAKLKRAFENLFMVVMLYECDVDVSMGNVGEML